MNNLLLDIVQRDGKYYFSEPAEAFIYALLGFLIVFAGIVIIILIIRLLGLVMQKTDNMTFSGKKKSAAEQKPAETAMGDDVPDEVKAAIIAAVMAYCAEQKPECEFKVKRIKRL